MSFDFGCPTISALASLTCSSLYMFSYSTIYVTGGKQHGPRCQCKAYACGEDTWRCKSPGKWSYRTFRLYKQFVAWKQKGSRCYWVKKQVEPLYITPQGAAWRLTRDVEVVGSTPIKGPHCVLEQETLSLLLSTGWLQERIRAWYHNQTKINWGPYGRST